MIELATKTITAESRIGSHNDMIGTTVPPCESASGIACAVLDSPKPSAGGNASQPTHDSGADAESVRRFFAHRAASDITGSGSCEARSTLGRRVVLPLLPIAMSAFLRRPECLVRLTGERRNFSRNSASEISASQASAVLTSPSRGWNSGLSVVGALRFHGQTSWQMSQPN